MSKNSPLHLPPKNVIGVSRGCYVVLRCKEFVKDKKISVKHALAVFRVRPEHRIFSVLTHATKNVPKGYFRCKWLPSQQIPLLLIYVKIRTQISLKCKRTLIYFAGSSRWKKDLQQEKGIQFKGTGVGECLFACMWISMTLDIRHVPILPFLPVVGLHPVDAQKYQHVPVFGTDDIFSCLLVIDRKLSWGTFWECHVTGVTKRRINTMFRTNAKRN